ncbi:MAG TPA: bifunctional 3,4-dihydroxy-2-butanone-4-phosphate synthase/GTP cyclohydrolase II [Steroidobacteraceae bacterium]|nr:bifunctional 3,4-dihydroxy-2-butanone-4-phosphate synthase/GTP cyclohydrolase II [Steroidobacteraceae bacterium]
MGSLNTIDEILEDIRKGRMVVIMDDEDRENEGDLVMAATMVRPEDVNFMARYGRGLICLTLSRERCRQLRLPLMVSDTDLSQRTNFTLSIEAAEGITTGISAYDRARTVRAAVGADAKPEDLRQPGHIFPLMAQPGGVLTRAGHTEAGCDLARLAGLEPAAMIVEVLNEDGTMARRPDLEKFAAEHGIKIGTIADLIRYRLEKERSVERIAERDIQTEFGAFRLYCYEDHVNRTVHLALVCGQPEREAAPLVRVHLKETVRDLIGVVEQGHSWSLRSAMQRIAREGSGIVVLLRPDESPLEIAEAVRSQERPAAAPDSPRDAQVLRTYGIGAQILRDLGVRNMRVLSAPKQMHGLSAFGLEVAEYVD